VPDMTFEYNSSRWPNKKTLREELVAEIRAHLVDEGFDSLWTRGNLQDCLLRFRDTEGNRLLINQLEPIFTYLSMTGQLWPE
jgi:hypothetical protein